MDRELFGRQLLGKWGTEGVFVDVRFQSADANLDASIEDYDAILVSLIGETATAYIDYRVAQARLAYARENVRIQEGSLKLSETRFRNGAVTELDVTQATDNLQNTKQLIPLRFSSCKRILWPA